MKFSELKTNLFEDYKAMVLTKIHPSLYILLKTIIINYKFRIIVRLRLSQYLIKKGWLLRKFAHVLYFQNLRRSIDISPYTSIGKGLRIAHPIGIVIGDRCRIGDYPTIMQNVTIGGTNDKELIIDGIKYVMPVISDFVEVGTGATLLGPIFIEEFARIGANSLVLNNVKRFNIVGGIPARILKEDTQPHHHGLVQLFYW